jgi:hypothetical protein
VATIVSPYFTLALQVAGVVAAAAILVMLVRPLPRVAAVPTVVTLVLAVVAVPQLWGFSGSLDTTRTGLQIAPGIGSTEACLVEAADNTAVPFVRWLKQRMPPSATFAYVSRAYDEPCFQLAMLPRLITPPTQRPEYTVYADPPDPASRRRLARERRLLAAQRRIQFFAPNLALERNR